MANPSLNLIYLDTHSSINLAIGDSSIYPAGFNVSTPTIEITPPSFHTVSIPFVANSIQLYNSESLEITPAGCELTALPDGIYTIKYSVYPAYLYYVEKTFLRVDKLLEEFDRFYLRLDMMVCDAQLKYQDKQSLDDIQDWINGAIAAANNCANKFAMELYAKAHKALQALISGNCCLK